MMPGCSGTDSKLSFFFLPFQKKLRLIPCVPIDNSFVIIGSINTLIFRCIFGTFSNKVNGSLLLQMLVTHVGFILQDVADIGMLQRFFAAQAMAAGLI